VFAVWKAVPNAVCAIDVVFFRIGCLVSEWANKEEDENSLDIMKSALSMGKPSHLPRIECSPLDSKLGCIYTPAPGDVPDWVVQGYDMMEKSVCVQQQYITVTDAVYFGSSGGSWWSDKEGCYWEAGREDLNPEGRELLKTLEDLHGDRALLLTVLDT